MPITSSLIIIKTFIVKHGFQYARTQFHTDRKVNSPSPKDFNILIHEGTS